MKLKLYLISVSLKIGFRAAEILFFFPIQTTLTGRTVTQAVCVFFFSSQLLPKVGIVPGEPTDVVVTEATKSYVVLAWKPPVQRGHEGVMYFIEKVSNL